MPDKAAAVPAGILQAVVTACRGMFLRGRPAGPHAPHAPGAAGLPRPPALHTLSEWNANLLPIGRNKAVPGDERSQRVEAVLRSPAVGTVGVVEADNHANAGESTFPPLTLGASALLPVVPLSGQPLQRVLSLLQRLHDIMEAETGDADHLCCVDVSSDSREGACGVHEGQRIEDDARRLLLLEEAMSAVRDVMARDATDVRR